MPDYFWFSLLVAANGLLLVVLALNVSLLRIKHGVSYGYGGNKKLRAAIRTHSNGAEHVPVYGLLILALTFLGASNALLAVLVIGFTLARVSHAAGMLWRIFPARRLGAGFTYIFQAVAVASILARLVF
ncbi:MAPEG family protein [Gallaecimonas sp. GXIMD4217]|uniref:MAPEG family protein n=1 Tax=Gallaecimonas sp. GXIMD4217 TaxID=3131927 RepID=UPI00311B29FE